jgi:hypothetical protein
MASQYAMAGFHFFLSCSLHPSQVGLALSVQFDGVAIWPSNANRVFHWHLVPGCGFAGQGDAVVALPHPFVQLFPVFASHALAFVPSDPAVSFAAQAMVREIVPALSLPESISNFQYASPAVSEARRRTSK